MRIDGVEQPVHELRDGYVCGICDQMTLDEAPGYEVEYFDRNGLVDDVNCKEG